MLEAEASRLPETILKKDLFGRGAKRLVYRSGSSTGEEPGTAASLLPLREEALDAYWMEALRSEHAFDGAGESTLNRKIKYENEIEIHLSTIS